jgi:DNA-binding beta-propeller fold protein YncE
MTNGLHPPHRFPALLLAAVAIGLFLAVLPVQAAAPPVTFIRSFGSGNGMQSRPGQLSTPEGVAIAPSTGDVLVVDNMNDRVQEFRQNGKFVTAFGKLGTGNGQFTDPSGIGINKAGDIYVADTGSDRVEEFGPNRHFLRLWVTAYSHPTYLAVAPNGYIYITGQGTDGIHVEGFTPSGGFYTQFGGPGVFASTAGGLAVGPNGHVYVGDYSGGRVEEWKASSGNATYVRSLANSGQAAVLGPIGVSVTKSAIFVSDNGHERAIELKPGGAFVRTFGTSGKGKLDNPGFMGIDCRGDVYVSDIDVGRVRQYGQLGGPRPPCHH